MNKKTIKKNIVKIFFPALLHTKAHLLFKFAYSGVGSILMFHRVYPEVADPRLQGNSGLEVTPEYLEKLIIYFSSKGYEFLSLDDVYKRLRERNFKNKFLAFTFDDGYADNYEFAFPILKKHGIPSTIYLSTNYPDHEIGPWWCSLEELLLKNDSLKFDLEKISYKFKTGTLPEKEDAFTNIRYLLMAGRGENPASRINEFFSIFNMDPTKLAKELIADALEEKDIKIGGKNIGEILNTPEYQRNIEQKISKIVKMLILEFFEKGMDFKEKTKTIRKERKVGTPKVKRKSGRPKQGLD